MLADSCFLIGLTLICGISLWDDIASLPNRVRVLVHVLAISPVFYGVGVFASLPICLIIIAYIVFVGILNAYNFMDGINGITGLYSLVILTSLQYVNCQFVPFTDTDFINYAIIACIVFLFFNFRQRARCFAGDVGSMGIAFWIITLLLQLMLTTRSVIWILFLAIYGVDTVCTILHRLYLGQDIFEAHRMHFYQVLSNEKRISHRKVAMLYAGGQALVCYMIISVHAYCKPWEWIAGGGVLVLLSLVYLLKFRWLSR
jgi:UDP-N-acetylmuramyl pentapeptide phosphotransferase/UDP-N-acetylglucosamine-1-phosphate transferase